MRANGTYHVLLQLDHLVVYHSFAQMVGSLGVHWLEQTEPDPFVELVQSSVATVEAYRISRQVRLVLLVEAQAVCCSNP